MTPDENDIPGELRRRDQWANWSSEVLGWTHHPKQPFYGPTRETAWTSEDGSGSFHDALGHTFRHDNRGIGYVFRENDPYLPIDIDGCLKGNGDLKDWCPKPPWLTEKEWAEVSISEGGLHTAVKGVSLPWWWTNNEFEDKEHVGVEVYDGNRFFAFTGNRWKNHGTTIPVVDQGTFVGWLKDVYRTVGDDTPWEREPPQRPSESSQRRESDVELGIYDVISRSQHPKGERTSHPFHGSSSGINFKVDDDGEPTWRCFRHGFTGNFQHLLGMDVGVLDCGERIGDKWGEICDRAREQGYDIPPKKPQDDSMMSMQERADEYEQRMNEWYEAQYEAHRDDIEESEDTEDETPRVDTEETTSQPSVEADGGSDWETIRELYESSDKGTTSKANYKASQMLISEFNPKALRGSKTIYCFDPETGYYVDDGRCRIKKTLRTNLGPEFNKARMYEVLNHIESDTYIDREELAAPEDMVCVQNGVLDLSDPEDLELLDHSPDYGFTWKLDTPYDPDATNQDFLDFLDETINPEDIPKLQEYTGDALRHWEQPDKMGILLGPTNAGKGTYLHVIEDVFGSGNVSAETIGRLVGDRWAPNSIYGRPLNIANELSTDRIKHQEMVKTLVGGGDAIQAEEKGQPVYKFVPTANHLFAANEVPDVPSGDEAFYGRWIFVTFPRTIPVEEQDRDLDDKLVGTDEKRAGILNWLIEGHARGQSLAGAYTNEKSIPEKIAQWKSFGTPVERFTEICIETENASNDDLISQRDLYEVYKQMCEEMSLRISVNQKEMVEELDKLPNVRTTHPSANTIRNKGATVFDVSRPRCLRGLRLTDRGKDLYEKVIDENFEDDPTEDRDSDYDVETFSGMMEDY